MRLADFRNPDFREFEDFEIEDPNFFWTLAVRIIEDLDVAGYVLAKTHEKETMDDTLTRNLVRLIDPETQLPMWSGQHRFIGPGIVSSYSRAPVSHTDKGRELVSSFVSFHISHLLRDAARRAAEEGLRKIKLRHILPWCERWPYPLNRFC